MGTITSRPRGDGTTGHTAQIRLKKDGKIIHTESKTFDRRPAAQAWLKKRETELAVPGALQKAKVVDPTLGEVIDQYIRETKRDIGRTKTQVLRSVKASSLGELQCSEIGSTHILNFAQGLGVLPQTVNNYLSHLSPVFSLAGPAWGYPLDAAAMAGARTVASALGVTKRSGERSRRPTLKELDKLMTHFGVIRHKRKDSVPMQEIVAYAIFSTRRQEEITRQVFEDMDEGRSDIWVRDMKHPGEKIGNDARTMLVPQARQLIVNRRGDADARGRIFPYNADTISKAFTVACRLLEIEDLTFHDLRHDGISRLFEMGWTIPQVATVSGHRTWTSLKRYTHIREAGDKYDGWPWLKALGIAP